MSEIKSIFSHLKDGIDEKSAEYLAKALEKNNMPGFDYIEFKQSLNKIASLNLDDSQRFQATFMTGSTVGLTKEKLIETAGQYKQILAKEKAQFDVALKSQIQQRIDGKKEELDRLLQQIKENQQRIKVLETEIDQYQVKANDITGNMDFEQQKINKTRDSFDVTYNAILVHIDQDIAKFNQFL
jgi:chromosome segregation ATPase